MAAQGPPTLVSKPDGPLCELEVALNLGSRVHVPFEPKPSNAMESELESLQKKIMDLENKLNQKPSSVTHQNMRAERDDE